jgi:nucleotide-binding universal stress UspA family protein
MKILIAVDESSYSERAVEFAAQMRWPAGSTVLVASVVASPPPASAALDAPTAAELLSALEQDRRRHQSLIDRAQDRLRRAGFCVDGRLLAGDPREQILEAIEREQVSLLVVGSHGRTGLARILLGSVSSHAVAHAPCSVLVVKAA